MAAQSTPIASLQVKRTFAASRETVFEAWTHAEALKAWFCNPAYDTVSAEADLRVGGKYRLDFIRKEDGVATSVFGTYREIDPPKKLVFTWKSSNVEGMNDTLVTVEFSDVGGSTEMTLTHELFQTEELRSRHKEGWNTVLKGLERYLA